jgi:hypothetical protein
MRHYLPGLGRFISRVHLRQAVAMGKTTYEELRDEWGINIGPLGTPEAFARNRAPEHPYAYAEGDPVNRVDPSGLVAVNVRPCPCRQALQNALSLLSRRLSVQPNCVAAFRRIGCGDIQHLLQTRNGPPTLVVTGGTADYGYYPEGTNTIKIERRLCTSRGVEMALAATIAHETAHWCAWQRRGRHPDVVEPPEGYQIEMDCFGKVVW